MLEITRGTTPFRVRNEKQKVLRSVVFVLFILASCVSFVSARVFYVWLAEARIYTGNQYEE